MKKVISILLLLSMLVCMIPAVSLTSYAEENPTIEPDTSWYDAEKTDFYLYDAADLLGLGKMLAYHDGTSAVYNNAFNDKTINIMNDIDLNPGWDASTGSKPTNIWPVMPDSRDFAGTINGNGHTISGVYQKSTNKSSGMFGRAWGNTINVSNIAFKNMYSESSVADGHGTLFGIVTGSCNATFTNVYVEATVVNTDKDGGSYGIGGIVGAVEYSSSAPWTTVTMTDCVFNGTISVNKNVTADLSGNTYIGGLIGRTNDKGKKSFTNCATYGTIEGNISAGSVGGIIGYISNTSDAINYHAVTDCVSSMNVNVEGDYSYGVVCGSSSNVEYKIDINNVFYTDSTENVKLLGGTIDAIYTGSTAGTYPAVAEYVSSEGLWSKIQNIEYTYTYIDRPTGQTSGFADYVVDNKKMTGWSANGNKPMPTAVFDMLATPVAEIVGYQATDEEDGKFNFRIVGVLNVEDLANTVLSISATATYTLDGEKTLTLENYPITTVYTSIAGDTDTGLVTYDAKELGGNYIFVLPCKNVPADATDIKVEITVRYAVDDDNGTATRTLYVEAPKDAVN